MAARFGRRDDDVARGTGAHSATATDDATRVDDRDHVRDEHVRDDDHLQRGGVDRGTMAAVRERQRDEFGGIAWGSSFFGWLTAVGLGAILAGILSAIGAALALTEGSQLGSGQESAETIGLIGGIALLAVVAISYFCGGYVAGRMARFDGARQGIGVFAWAIIIAAALAIAAAIGGSEWNVFQRVDLPRLPVDEGDLTTGGIIALVAMLLTMLVSAIFGGKVGERFHRKVDRHAIDQR